MTHPHTGARLAVWALTASILTLAAGCDVMDRVISVESPSRVITKDLEVPANAQVIVNGAVADFQCALSSYVLVASLVSDELHDASQNSRWWDYDRRTVKPSSTLYATGSCTGGGLYTPLSTARWQADNALDLLNGWTDAQVPQRSDLIATAAAYSGYSYLLLGEAMCSAAIDGGPELTREALFADAEERFTTAIAAAQSAGTSDILNLAYVGRARTRLNLGRKDDAAADARVVPDGFVYDATYSASVPLQYNQVYVANRRNFQATVEEPFRDVRYEGVADSRVQIVDDSDQKGPDQETPMYYAAKFTDPGSPIPIAGSEEARLIIAEAEGGQAAVAIINQLHAAAGLPPFQSTDPAEIMNQILYERRAEFFLDGHRLGDLIRYKTPLDPAAGTPYQAQKGGSYGAQLCFPLPDVERQNNPNLNH